MRFNTTDLWLASYMVEQGLALVNYDKKGPGKLLFTFDASEDTWKSMNISYLSSDIHRVRQGIDNLKSLLYQ
jgi:hypothetical protein